MTSVETRSGKPWPEEAPLWIADDARIMGGGQHFVVRVCSHIRRTSPRRQVAVVCPAGSELGERLARLGVEVVDLRFPDPSLRDAWRFAAAAQQLRSTLRSAGSQAVWVCNSARAGALTALAGVGLGSRPRIVHLMHERDSASRSSARFVYRRHGSLVAIGANAAAAYSDVLGGGRVSQINNFLDYEHFHPASGDGPRNALPPSIGVVARLIPEKGVIELVRELEAIPNAWSSLLVAGGAQDAAYARRVRSAIGAAGLGHRVELLGPVADVRELLSAVDVLLVPSTGFEAQPTTILEALACGRPVAVRSGVWSRDYSGLPVASYRTPQDLGDFLGRLPDLPVPDQSLLRERFGPEQAIVGIERAARS